MSRLDLLASVALFFGMEDIVTTRAEGFSVYESVNKYLKIDQANLTYTFKDKSADVSVLQIFFPEGNMKTMLYLKHGLRHGKCSEFYPNGKVKMTAEYVQDKIQGSLKMYCPEGKLIREDSYDGDGDVFKITEYHPNGRVMKVSELNKAKETHGSVKEFFENGKPRFVLFYENGHQKGFQYEYHPTGKIKEYIFVN
jgi:antitoxin component YwqK of YwqJK toxin-antitoxin module